MYGRHLVVWTLCGIHTHVQTEREEDKSTPASPASSLTESAALDPQIRFQSHERPRPNATRKRTQLAPQRTRELRLVPVVLVTVGCEPTNVTIYAAESRSEPRVIDRRATSCFSEWLCWRLASITMSGAFNVPWNLSQFVYQPRTTHGRSVV